MSLEPVPATTSALILDPQPGLREPWLLDSDLHADLLPGLRAAWARTRHARP